MFSLVALFLVSTNLIVGSVPLAPGLHDAGHLETFLGGPSKFASQLAGSNLGMAPFGYAPEGHAPHLLSQIGRSPHLHGALAPLSFPSAGLSDTAHISTFLEVPSKIASQLAGSNLGMAPFGYAPGGHAPHLLSQIGRSPHLHGALAPLSFPSAGLSDASGIELAPRALAPHHHASLNHGVNHLSNLALSPTQLANAARPL